MARWTGETSGLRGLYPAHAQTLLEALSVISRKEFEDGLDSGWVVQVKSLSKRESTLWRCESGQAQGTGAPGVWVSIFPLTIVS